MIERRAPAGKADYKLSYLAQLMRFYQSYVRCSSAGRADRVEIANRAAAGSS